MSDSSYTSITPRQLVAAALADQAQQFPELHPSGFEPNFADPRDTRLALVIYRTVMQRWLTLKHLLNQHLNKPLNTLEPQLQGILLSAAAQLLFMQRLPAHAIVDESVKLARVQVRPGAAGMVNAVLRKLAAVDVQVVPDEPWTPAVDCLPLEQGYLQISEAVLPAWTKPVHHLSAACSCPRQLMDTWIKQFGLSRAAELAAHSVVTPPIIVVPGEHAAHQVKKEISPFIEPHVCEGFAVWTGSHDELVDAIDSGHVDRVQDPTSSLAVNATDELSPAVIMDYCAGRGTKTRQLARLHPQANIIATDANPRHVETLSESLADQPHVQGVAMDELMIRCKKQTVELLILDVPCSNTGTIARRPEARYRYSKHMQQRMIEVQREIIAQALRYLKKGGYVLYSTCSIESEENQQQADWLCREYRGKVLASKLTLPEGHHHTYRDGGYYALIRIE